MFEYPGDYAADLALKHGVMQRLPRLAAELDKALDRWRATRVETVSADGNLIVTLDHAGCLKSVSLRQAAMVSELYSADEFMAVFNETLAVARADAAAEHDRIGGVDDREAIGVLVAMAGDPESQAWR